VSVKRRPGLTPPDRETPDLFASSAELDADVPAAAIPADAKSAVRPASAASAAAASPRRDSRRSGSLLHGAPEVLSAPGESARSAVSVATITETVKDILEGAFPPLWVRGEVTDFKRHRNGHWYFTLRDQEASIRCVVWSRDVRRMLAAPDEGMTVVALGQVSLFPSRGDLQFAIRTLDSVGDGLWRKAFEKTRVRLERDGLLEPGRRRPLPFLPRRIAVITSADGAALHDIVSVVRRRNPMVEVVLIPAAVQGEGAVYSLCAALDRLRDWGAADVAIIGRGGGSREDLWPFNDERVARRVAATAMPIVSAVGHEVDISICDLVADSRAPTPSVAAEQCVPLLGDLRRLTASLGHRLGAAAAQSLVDARRTLETSARRSAVAARRIVEHRRLTLEGIAGTLHALSPLATMGRGFVLASDAAGHPVTSAASLRTNDEVHLRFRDGRVAARVEQVEAQRVRDGDVQ
jgi:exodeoxyribonuclease VII large subunit